MRTRVLALLVPLLALWCANASAQFTGTLEFVPAGCEKIGQCWLKNALRFVDPKGVAWEAVAGLPTDGASIPGIFQPIVGKPFDPSFLRPAVIHDHYCVWQVRPWRQTHRVFYDGLVAEGVPSAKAKTMYLAVLLGGPKWIELMPSASCGTNCIQRHTSASGTPGIYSRRADYTAPDVVASVQSVDKLLGINPDALSVEDIEKLATRLRPDDFFFKNGDRIGADTLGITQ